MPLNFKLAKTKFYLVEIKISLLSVHSVSRIGRRVIIRNKSSRILTARLKKKLNYFYQKLELSCSFMVTKFVILGDKKLDTFFLQLKSDLNSPQRPVC